MTDQGNTPRGPLDDLRDPQQRADDRPAVEEQVQSLLPPDARTRGDVDVLERLRRRQMRRGGTPFDVHRPDNGDIPALVVRGELVSRTEDASLSRLGNRFRNFTGNGRPGRKTRVFRSEGRGAEELREDAKILRGNNVEANVNL